MPPFCFSRHEFAIAHGRVPVLNSAMKTFPVLPAWPRLRLAFLRLPSRRAAAGQRWPPPKAPPRRRNDAPPASMGQVQLTFAPVVKRVAPAVVNVYARSVTQVQVNPLFNDPFFQQFFGASPEMRQRVQQSLGSGVIVRADGLILTNNHVVEGGTDIVVALSDKREFKAKVLLADPRTDLAVLKIDTKGERCRRCRSATATRCRWAIWCWRSAIPSASARP